MTEIYKIHPPDAYPPEEGCYLRGNDLSPVAVCVLLKWDREKTPPSIEMLVRTSIESGAALAGTLQTENIGIEKIICNMVANPNLRYLLICGPEPPGHLVGDALLALSRNGLDKNRRIIEAKAPTPYLFNLPLELVERFRKQITLIDLIDEGSPDIIRQAVCACYQEQPTAFRNYQLYDPGAYPEPPLCSKITWRVSHPEREPTDAKEREAKNKLLALMTRINKAVEEKRAQQKGGQ